MRARGTGRVYLRGSIWWISYCWRGKEHRETSGSPKRSVASKLLRARLGEMGAGKLVSPTEKHVMFEDLGADIVRERKLRGARSAQDVEYHLVHLRAAFRFDRAIDITPSRIRAYVETRLAEAAAPATINRELSTLIRMFNIARGDDRLLYCPKVSKLAEAEPRQGFFEHPEYLAVRAQLADVPAYQDVLDFAYFTGWRRREITGLEWGDVDLAGRVIRLRPSQSKSRIGRVYAMSGEALAVIERRDAARTLVAPLVFHRAGAPVGDWRKVWKRACKDAGVPDKLFHDLRRTVVRNLTRSGTPERLAMSITGHRTRKVFDRYNIVTEDDLRRAAESLERYHSGLPTSPTVVPVEFAQNSHNRASSARRRVGRKAEKVGFIGGADETRTRDLRSDR